VSGSTTATITPPPTGTKTPSMSYSDTYELSDTNNVSTSESVSAPSPSIGSVSASNSTEPTVSESLGALLLIYPRVAVATGARTPASRRQQEGLGDSYPTLFSNAIRKGIPESERMLVFTILGDGFATRQQHGVSLYNCLSYETQQAPRFRNALGKVWTSKSLLANTSYLTITFQPFSGFQVNNPEVVSIRFSPFCFMSRRTPVHNTFEFVIAAGGSVTDPPAPVVSAETTEPAERASSAAVAGTTAIGAPSASALALTKATSLASIAACNGRASTLSFIEHPTGLHFDVVAADQTDDSSSVTANTASNFVTAMIMNTCIAIGFVLLHGAIVFTKHQRQLRAAHRRAGRWAQEARERGIPPRALQPPSRPTLAEAMGSVVFPSRSVVTLLFFPTLVKCGVFLFFTVEAAFPLIVAFALLAPWMLLFFGGAFVVIGPRFSAKYRKKRDIAEAEQREREKDLAFEMTPPPRHAERSSRAHDLGLDDDDDADEAARGAWRRRMQDTAEDGPTPAALGRRAAAKTARTPHTASRHLRERSARRSGMRDDGDAIGQHRPTIFGALFRPRGEWQDLGVLEAQRAADRARREQITKELDSSDDDAHSVQSDADAPRNPAEAAAQTFTTYVAALDPWRRSFVGRFGDLFTDFHGSARYFLLVDALVAVVAGGLDGYAAASGSCFPLAIVLLVLFCLYLLFLLVKRPFTVVANNVFFVAVAAVQVGLAILAVMYLYSDKGDKSTLRTLVTLSVVLQFGLIARALVDVVALAHLTVVGHRDRAAKERREEAEALDTAISAYYAGQEAAAKKDKDRRDHPSDGGPTPPRPPQHPATMPLSPPPAQPNFGDASPMPNAPRLRGDPTIPPWEDDEDEAKHHGPPPALPHRERFADAQPVLRLPDASELRDELSWRRPDASPSHGRESQDAAAHLPVPGPEGSTARAQPSVPDAPWRQPTAQPPEPPQRSRPGLRPPEWDAGHGDDPLGSALASELQGGLQRGGTSQRPFETPVGRRVHSAIARAPHQGAAEMSMLMDALDEFDAEADLALGPSPPRATATQQRRAGDESDLDDLL